jgi:hypothetical protein
MPRRHIGEPRYISIFLDLGTRWRWVVSYTPLPLYPRRNSPQYPLDRMGWPRVGLDAVQKRRNLHCRESNLSRPARSPPLYWLSYPDSSHQPGCLYLYPPILARQQLGKHVPAPMNIRNSRRIVGRVLWKESRRLVLPRTYCLFIGY